MYKIPLIKVPTHYKIGELVKKYAPKSLIDFGGVGRTRLFVDCSVRDINIINGIDATNSGFLNNSYDVAVSVATLEHIKDQYKFLTEAARIARVATIHWFPFGVGAEKVEGIKKKLGHKHSCKLPKKEMLFDYSKTMEKYGVVKQIPYITCREHLFLLAAHVKRLNNNVLHMAADQFTSEFYGTFLITEILQ